MKLRTTLYSFLFVFLSIGLVFTSCEEDDDDDDMEVPALDRGHTEANKLELVFSRVIGSTTTVEDTAIVDLSSGFVDSLIISRVNSANAPIIYEGIARFYQGNNEVTSIINDKDFDYIVCYRNFQTQELQLNNRNLDSDGKTLGLITEWRTLTNNTSGRGTIKLTLNYQPLRKDGLCDAGVRIFEYNVPYRLK